MLCDYYVTINRSDHTPTAPRIHDIVYGMNEENHVVGRDPGRS
jgi:ABC-type hemin transport system substrate-binding protein